jgi:pyruvate formate lyase activating enzyme
MKFSGLRKTSLIDFPDKVASVLFTPGCNIRCPYCYNWRIVADPKPPFLNENNALQILRERRKYVDAVVVTGGEPSIHRELPKFLKKLKELGFYVKLDTNGLYFNVIKECLPYTDYIALDVKTSQEKYPRLGAKDTAGLLRTIETLRNGKLEYEFRTTVVPGIVDDEDIPKIGEMVKGAKIYALQQFIPDDPLDTSLKNVKPYPPEKINFFAKALEEYVEKVVLRI